MLIKTQFRKIRMNVKLAFGLSLDGILVHIDAVANGKACNCVCPNCRDPLIAKNNQKNVITHHFSHSGSECAGGGETAIHLMAKQIVVTKKRVLSPLFNEQPEFHDLSGKMYSGERIYIKPTIIRADNAEQEVDFPGFTPDIVFDVNGKKLLIEIQVTHKVDDEKKEKVQNAGMAMMEVDLSGINQNILRDEAEFSHYVITKAPRTWISYPEAYEALLVQRDIAIEKRSEGDTLYKEKQAIKQQKKDKLEKEKKSDMI